MRRACVVVPADIARQGDIRVAPGASDADAAAAIPDFSSAKVVEDLRAGMGRSTALEDSRNAAPADAVVVIAPPDRSFRAWLEDVGNVAGLGETNVELAHRAADDRMGAIPDDPAVFVLVEAQQDEVLRVPAGLGDP